jgi:hypothetical protein
MSDVTPLYSLALQVSQSSPLFSRMLQVFVISGLFVVAVSVAIFFVLRGARPKNDGSVSSKINEEFEKSKDALLLAAQAKKAKQEAEAGAQRSLEVEAKEMELLRENVDPARVFGVNDPYTGIEMTEDSELIIDPYTGTGYFLSSFLTDWPVDLERPKYVYRYPQGTVVRTNEMIRALRD